jgi:hypothetical protein
MFQNLIFGKNPIKFPAEKTFRERGWRVPEYFS